MVRFIQPLWLLSMNGMVNMIKMGLKIHGTMELIRKLKERGLSYRKEGREIIKDISEDLSNNLKEQMYPHDVLGIARNSIKVIPGRWITNKKVEFSEVIYFLEKGTRPHAIPDGRAELYADNYGMSAKQFWYMIYKKGTKAYPVITNAMIKTRRNVPKIIKQNMRKR